MLSGESFGNKDFRSSETEQQKSNGCFIDKTKTPNEMEKYDASLQDMSRLVQGLDSFGKAEYKGFPGFQSGPILVVFRENHKNNEVKLDNFNAFLENRNYFNFLSTEGVGNDIDINVSSNIEVNKAKIQWILLNGGNNFSSEAIENYYLEQLNTCGVDMTNTEWNQKEKDRKQAFDKNLKNILFGEEGDLYGDFVRDILTIKRNTIFLTNMRDILISGNNNSGKNFIPIVVGGAHAQDLSVQAQNFGFKGVIIFTPNSYSK